MNAQALGLGRKVPPDWQHVEKYPITAIEADLRPKHAPVIVGFNWYENFDRPVKGTDGRYRVGGGDLGSIRGGHCFCFEPAPQSDEPEGWQERKAWWRFFNQGSTPACEGFGHGRAMALIHRRTFDPFWLYDDARRVEGAYPDGEGSTNRSASAALVKWGAHFEDGPVALPEKWHKGAPGEKIKAYRWLTSADQVLAALGYPSGTGELPFLNSWGHDYPEVVYMPDTVIERLLTEEGEAEVFTSV